MPDTFKATSYKIATGEWVPRAVTTTVGDGGRNHSMGQPTFHDDKKATKEEADAFVREHFLGMGVEEEV